MTCSIYCVVPLQRHFNQKYSQKTPDSELGRGMGCLLCIQPLIDTPCVTSCNATTLDCNVFWSKYNSYYRFAFLTNWFNLYTCTMFIDTCLLFLNVLHKKFHFYEIFPHICVIRYFGYGQTSMQCIWFIAYILCVCSSRIIVFEYPWRIHVGM